MLEVPGDSWFVPSLDSNEDDVVLKLPLTESAPASESRAFFCFLRRRLSEMALGRSLPKVSLLLLVLRLSSIMATGEMREGP